MSPRTNNYLSLCLSQANQSPLHYRHGAIIVRGGKVIGQGFNTYRPGFDGGCLKTGVLPSSTADGHAIAELKMRVKTKTKMKENPKFKHENQQSISGDTFVPFEEISTGVGGICAGPLSMHSEMMAIQSALSLSSGAQSSQVSARGVKWLKKPQSSGQSDSRRKNRGRGLRAYVKAVCEEAETFGDAGKISGGARGTARFCVQEPYFEAGASKCCDLLQRRLQWEQERETRHGETECSRGPPVLFGTVSV